MRIEIDDITKKTILGDLKKVIGEIRKCHSKSTYYRLIEELEMLYELSETIMISEDEIPDVTLYATKKYDDVSSNYVSNYFRKIRQLHDFNDDLAYLSNTILTDSGISIYDIDKPVILTENVDIDLSYKYAGDFLKIHNIKMYDGLETIIKANHFLLQESDFSSSSGATWYGFNSFLPYITITTNNDINDAVTIVHESGHLYDYNKETNNFKKVSIKNEDFMSEVLPHFLELSFYDYLESINFNNHDVKALRKEFDRNFLLYNKNFEEFEYDKKNYEKYFEIRGVSNYAYGFLIAYYLYDKSLEDVEKVNYQIDKMLHLDKTESVLSVLKSMEVDEEELLDEKIYLKHISKHF